MDIRGAVERFLLNVENGVKNLIKKFQAKLDEEIVHQTATIGAQRTRASRLDYRKTKNQRRNLGHWRP